MSRIGTRLQKMRAEGRKALVAYIVSGDPTPEATLATMHAMVAKGVDIIELGVPFSDPMAEGPVIQKAHERALVHGMSLRGTFELVRKFRETDQETPVALMGYLNPIERMGYKAVAEAAAQAGVDGLLTVDMPPEEAGPFNDELKALGLDNILLLAPTTTVERAKRITALASGFLYYVSLKGVTGAGHLDVESVRAKLAEFSNLTDVPICVGFGIKDPETARAIADFADGVIVGSALVSQMGDLAHADSTEIADTVADLVGRIRVALDA